jgi:hypothetical protein
MPNIHQNNREILGVKYFVYIEVHYLTWCAFILSCDINFTCTLAARFCVEKSNALLCI